MKPSQSFIRIIARCAVIITGLALPAAAAPTKPVRIFLLSGQSNMTGRGTLGDFKKPPADQKATLLRYIMAPENVEKYQFLHNGPDKTRDGWTIRNDVFITTGDWPHAKPGEEGFDNYRKHGGLAPCYGGFRHKGFGPELGIGHVLGAYYEEPVVLVKVAFGANSLAANFRPPSSGGTLGDKYPLVVKAVRDAIGHLPEIVPGYDKQQGYEITGFFWNQGVHDMNDKFAGEYGKNLTNLIRDLRKDLKAPDMKTVVAVTGNGGWDLAEMLQWKKTQEEKDAAAAPMRKVTDAQLAVSKLPEFKGTVATTETRDFWRPQEEHGGNKQGVHWHGNGESYWLIGEAMGRDMVKLLGAKK